MLGDKILFRDYHHQQADDVICRIDSNNKRQVILIGGCSGAGKTETAILIQNYIYKCKLGSLILSLDDYYNTHWRERDNIRKERGIDSVGLKEIEWSHLINSINCFKENRMMSYFRLNKFSNARETISTKTDFNFLIVEGLYSLYLKDIADVSHRINVTPEDTYNFRKERGKENPDCEWRKQIIQKEYEEVMKL